MFNANEEELKVLKFWQDDNTFAKSVLERPENKPYVFYDGPPFATGLPHYGHIVASLMKDVVPRYWTMNGFRVERKWGWDCHGLPIENIIEQDLNLKTKQDIENFGIGNFNEACRATVLKYAEEWKKTIKRMGRWVDMENDYKTMDVEYMESVWWVFKQLWDKELIYKGHKSMHVCPRCETPLSNFEVTQGYKDVKDLSLTVKFKLLDEENTYILAWTTTAWTLPANMFVAVGPNIEYVKVKANDEYYIVGKKLLPQLFEGKEYTIVQELKSSDLVGRNYEPLFPFYKEIKNGLKVWEYPFVSELEGTGLVHMAAFGDQEELDFMNRNNIELIIHLKMDGTFVDEVGFLAGKNMKSQDIEIKKYLVAGNKLFNSRQYLHSYPHCWRCDTPLFNFFTDSWFIKVTELKEQLLKNNEKISWVPEHIKEGRFGLWLAGARDWAISRNRYWGTPLPVWESANGDWLCVGSVKELEELTGKKVADLHKHKIDNLVIEKDGKTYKRIPEVLDCWFESGSMPYGQMHYPFENKTKFEAGFPAEFIAEGQDQTRGWFYTLHILATALTNGKNPVIPVKTTEPAFKNVIVNGIVLAEDGKKMSKRLKNYPDPNELLEKYGADAMRYYLVTSPVMEAESLNFSEAGVREVYNKLVNTLWNVVEFYKMYADEGLRSKEQGVSGNVLDKWILAKLNLLVQNVTIGMQEYKLVDASRPIVEFVTELSQWYVRRSRDRFKNEENLEDKQFALATLREVLITLSKVMAPFTPFIAEKIWHLVTDSKESVHLQVWPTFTKATAGDAKIIEEMSVARKIVEMGLAARAESGMKVRQPLQYIRYQGKQLSEELEKVIAEEINVKEVKFTEEIREQEDGITKEDAGIKIRLNITITPELKKEGLVREIVRTINQIRKEQKLTIQGKVVVEYSCADELLKQVFVEYNEEIKKSVLAVDVVETGHATSLTEVEIDGIKVSLKVEKR